nr:ubiquitin carboxyl-terminal hydrolase 1-like [Nerophis lumbriciformis]
MPGLQGEHVVAPLGSPTKRSKLSLRFFQKKETKRALDFSESQPNEANSNDQVVPAPYLQPSSPDIPLTCDKREDLLPFVGLSNGGNTCYLNSILQVLYHCPGLKEGIKSLYKLSKKNTKPPEELKPCEEPSGDAAKSPPAHIELLESLHSLIRSVERLQSKFLLNSNSFMERELDTSPHKVLNTLRQLNPMYEGYLQHDAQEALQCILGYIQEACNTIKKEQEQDDNTTKTKVEHGESLLPESHKSTDEDCQVAGKRKSDTEMGNAKKKAKSQKSGAEECMLSAPVTRSKRKSTKIKVGGEEEAKEVQKDEEERSGGSSDEKTFKAADRKKKKGRKLSWLKSAGKQPSIMSVFQTVGKLTSTFSKSSITPEQENDGGQTDEKCDGVTKEEQLHKAALHQDGLDLMERLFQGQLVLRTRCLECESFTERREDFQDISVPVMEEQHSDLDDLSSVSPYPKAEEKTLNWAIAQFASVERIAGEDKYFCDTCRHYAEAERSLLFDKTPEVITIHLKRFSACNLEMDPHASLSKVNAPLQTPLTLSLEEWCTPRSSGKGYSYELFAVVMHSGLSIGSGHYTAYVRMAGLKDAKFWLCETDPLEESEEAARDDCNGGVKQCMSSPYDELGGKEPPDAVVGLLGGQRSRTEREEKVVAGGAKDGSDQRKTLKQKAEAECKNQTDDGEESRTTLREEEQEALNNLLKYEGKWLQFDDSEVTMFEEADFLRACFPQTNSSSTPYLLFYKRIPVSKQ